MFFFFLGLFLLLSLLSLSRYFISISLFILSLSLCSLLFKPETHGGHEHHHQATMAEPTVIGHHKPPDANHTFSMSSLHGSWVRHGSLKSGVGYDGLIYSSWVLILGGFWSVLGLEFPIGFDLGIGFSFWIQIL